MLLQAYSVNRLTAVPSLMRTILPVLQAHADMGIESSLKLLVLSGETFPFTLWKILSSILPKTSILNLYGSTEVRAEDYLPTLRIYICCLVPAMTFLHIQFDIKLFLFHMER